MLTSSYSSRTAPGPRSWLGTSPGSVPSNIQQRVERPLEDPTTYQEWFELVNPLDEALFAGTGAVAHESVDIRHEGGGGLFGFGFGTHGSRGVGREVVG